jgi:salicylate hydroxylase
MVIEQSRLCGQILTGQMGLDPAAVAKYNTQAKRLEILSFDIGEDVIAAQEAFHKLRDEA